MTPAKTVKERTNYAFTPGQHQLCAELAHLLGAPEWLVRFLMVAVRIGFLGLWANKRVREPWGANA
jgi:hypothetical protein